MNKFQAFTPNYELTQYEFTMGKSEKTDIYLVDSLKNIHCYKKNYNAYLYILVISCDIDVSY